MTRVELHFYRVPRANPCVVVDAPEGWGGHVPMVGDAVDLDGGEGEEAGLFDGLSGEVRSVVWLADRVRVVVSKPLGVL